MLEGSEKSGKQNLTNKKVAKEVISFKSDTKNTKFPVEHTGTTSFSLLHVHICAWIMCTTHMEEPEQIRRDIKYLEPELRGAESWLQALSSGKAVNVLP